MTHIQYCQTDDCQLKRLHHHCEHCPYIFLYECYNGYEETEGYVEVHLHCSVVINGNKCSDTDFHIHCSLCDSTSVNHLHCEICNQGYSNYSYHKHCNQTGCNLTSKHKHCRQTDCDRTDEHVHCRHQGCGVYLKGVYHSHCGSEGCDRTDRHHHCQAKLSDETICDSLVEPGEYHKHCKKEVGCDRTDNHIHCQLCQLVHGSKTYHQHCIACARTDEHQHCIKCREVKGRKHVCN